MTEWMRGRVYLAAGAVMLLIVLIVLGPLGTGVWLGFKEMVRAVHWFQERLGQTDLQTTLDPEANPRLASAIDWFSQFSTIDVEQLRQMALKVATGTGQSLYQRTVELLGDLAQFGLALVMFLVALYFFLVDGERIIAGWEDLTPLDNEHDRVIRSEFCKVCRGVVWATVAAAIAQGVLLGIGLGIIELFAGAGLGKWIFLLSLLTIALAMIPFIGAAAVWLPIALYLFFQGHYIAGIVLGLYGALVVSTADNFIKVIVIKESASLHPLLVFVCVFGGLKLMGIIGIFVGPIVGAVLFSLLRILKREVIQMGSASAAAVVVENARPRLRRPRPFV
jgi:predicted PurR-regulated permease PerM